MTLVWISTLIYIILFGKTEAQTLALSVTPSSPLVGQEVTFTCTASQNITPTTTVLYYMNTILVGQYTINSTSCSTEKTDAGQNYILTCDSLPVRQLTLTIPAAYATKDEHGTNWRCDIFLGAASNTVQLTFSDMVTLSGSSSYAVPGNEFRMTCSTPEEAYHVQVYRRPNPIPVGSIQVGSGQCYNTALVVPVICIPEICSCTTTSDTYGTEFQWIIQPKTGDHGSVWYCRRTNPSLPEGDRIVESNDYILNMAYAPNNSISLTPPSTTYTRTEEDTLPDITCTADCRPGCTFVWTKPDNTNFTASAVLSLGQLDRSEHGTYRCTARNIVGESTITISVTVQFGPGDSIRFEPQEDVVYILENDTVPNVRCSADCRPACDYSWSKGGKQYNNPLSLSTGVRNNAGVYTCTASNIVNHGMKTWDLIVRYGPDVDLAVTNTTENTTNFRLLCTANGVPNQYTYRWIHKFGSTVIRDNFDHVTSSGSVSTLTIPRVTYQDMGTYICEVDNGYKGRDGQVIQTRQGFLSVIGSPRLVEEHDTHLAAVDVIFDITLTYISFPEPTDTSISRPDSTLPPQSELSITVSPVPVTMLFYKKDVSVGGYIINIHFSKFESKHTGKYRLHIRNEVSYQDYIFRIVLSGRPKQPLELLISRITSISAMVSWEPGNEQDIFETFRLTYQRHGDLSMSSVTLNKTTTAFTIEQLLPSTQYDVSVFAVNVEGTSEALSGAFVTLELHTKDARLSENNGNTGVALAGVGSVMILLSLLIFAVTIFMLRKGRLPYGRQNTTDKRSSTNKPHSSDDIGGVGQGERYEDLNLEQIEPPSEYDEVSNNQPEKGNESTGNTRNVYQNMQPQSTANTYEDIPPKPGTGSDGMYVNTAPK